MNLWDENTSHCGDMVMGTNVRVSSECPVRNDNFFLRSSLFVLLCLAGDRFHLFTRLSLFLVTLKKSDLKIDV